MLDRLELTENHVMVLQNLQYEDETPTQPEMAMNNISLSQSNLCGGRKKDEEEEEREVKQKADDDEEEEEEEELEENEEAEEAKKVDVAEKEEWGRKRGSSCLEQQPTKRV
ncbi:hypothetical protein PoB_003918900 [Plakobranchus ocellatus]|uniref:Uncharacterized protein n=1 Tax=Plakobranchus ocellatus TaxID=259542 RepID=A0AAV4B1X5_9GAST|nr:hypothetical protein PoB_003918900 [Plakobranchus ocellatus]